MNKEKHHAYTRATTRLKMIIECLRHGLDPKVCDPIIHAALQQGSKAKTGWKEVGDDIESQLCDAVRFPDNADRHWVGRMCEDLNSVYTFVKTSRFSRKDGRKMRSIQTIIYETQHEASTQAGNVFNRPVKIEVRGQPRKWANSHLIGPMWRQKTAACGGPIIGSRFILQADLVDQIGEYDLFQVRYLTNATEGNEQFGFVARYRGTTIRGFGAKPETALSWTRRQVIMRGTKALTK